MKGAATRFVGSGGAALLVLFATLAVATYAERAPRKRSVEIEITLPNGSVPRVIVPEDEGATIRLANLGRVGFVPNVRSGDDSVVVIAIWDLESAPIRQLGHVEVKVGGPAVPSETSPSFEIRVPRVIKPR